ncbi:peptidoglycan binding domain-containing protein [Mycobacterium tuberculosis]|nr:peptidoglycan binding domain-containing protein [Mycobacterium tuberculosis]
MPYLTQLAEVARRTGYPVTEVSGWRSRGHGPQPYVRGIVCHHTAGASGGGDYPSLGVVRDGRPGLDGPLSQFGLGRSGRIYVIAAGRCWHNAPSTSSNHTNSNSLGIEAENDGRQSWPEVQLDSYKRLCAELCGEFGLPASRVKGHKEVNTEKPDPHSIGMTAFRADVARLIEGDDMPLTDKDVEKVALAVWNLALDGPPGSSRDLMQAKNVLRETYGRAAEAKALAAQLLAGDPVDEDAVAAAVLAKLTPERIAAAIPQDIGEQVAEALAARLAAGPVRGG